MSLPTLHRPLVVRAGLCLLALGCSSSTSPGQDIEGFDTAAIQAAIETASEIPGMRSLLVARNGGLVSESYFNGIAADSTHDVRSVTKSFTSALVGIAIREGFLQGTDQTLGSLLAGTLWTAPAESEKIV